MESQDDSPLVNLSPFIIEKVITANLKPKTVKKLKNGNILVEVERKKTCRFSAENEDFSYQNHNASKGVVRSQELSFCPLEEIKKELKPQGVTELKRVTIKLDDKIIDTNTNIMTFDLPTISPKIKIGYTMERVEQFVPNPLRCYKCHEYGHHKDKCNGKSVCGKCGEQDLDHSTEKCKKTHRYANCGGDHLVYAKKEILSVKYPRNISFQEA